MKTNNNNLLHDIRLTYSELESIFQLYDKPMNRATAIQDKLIEKFAIASEQMKEKILSDFITEIKKEFADENWDYLDFIKERIKI